MNESILITGASGLLGRELVKKLVARDFQVLGQYHRHRPPAAANVTWLQADFSTLAGIRSFLRKNAALLKRCRFLVNNYGPITVKETAALTGDDFLSDFQGNVVVAVEITSFLAERAPLEAVVSVGFAGVGEMKPYKRILSYAAAKNALLLLTRSWARAYPRIRFHMVSPGTLVGAAVAARSAPAVPAARVAEKIFRTLLAPDSGRHFQVR